jgi:thiamine biosynthesis lipoprotein
MKKINIFLAVILVLMLGAWSIRSYNLGKHRLAQQTRFLMDTYVTVYAAAPKKEALVAINRAFERMKEASTKFNAYDIQSPLYLFNQKNVPISDPEVLKVIRAALDVSEKTDGAFDITVMPLTRLWGFSAASGPPRLPLPDEIKEALKNVGFRHLSFKDGKLVKDQENIQIGLGAIAKGYVVGEAIKVLKDSGITSAIVVAGGDVYALGKNRSGFWKVGIKNPRGDEPLGYLEVEDRAVMGSGDYERSFIKDNKRYHHIFDPRTGYPALRCQGTFVIYPDPILADAWATALFVMGPEAGSKIIEQMPDMESLVVTANGDIITSEGFPR